MALSTGPASTTSEWFINLADNSSQLDGATDGGPFTVFGDVVYGGMGVVSKIAALPVVDASGTNAAWNTLPVLNATAPVTASNEVVTTYSVVPALTYTVTSDNPSIVTPSVSGSSLTLNFGAATGVTQVHVTATDLGGNTATTAFTVGTGVTTATVGSGGAELVRFKDADGTASILALSGPGSATVSLLGSGLSALRRRIWASSPSAERPSPFPSVRPAPIPRASSRRSDTAAMDWWIWRAFRRDTPSRKSTAALLRFPVDSASMGHSGQLAQGDRRRVWLRAIKEARHGKDDQQRDTGPVVLRATDNPLTITSTGKVRRPARGSTVLTGAKAPPGRSPTPAP